MRDDVIMAVRQWRRTPAAGAVALLSLTLAIGGTLALSRLVDALLLRSLPIESPERLMRVVARGPSPDRVSDYTVAPFVLDYIRNHQPIFEEVVGAGAERVNISPAGAVRHVACALASDNYFVTPD
jgi:hypothetical protein